MIGVYFMNEYIPWYFYVIKKKKEENASINSTLVLVCYRLAVMSFRTNLVALRREIKAQFITQGLVLEQIMNILDAMTALAPPAPNG